MAISKLGSRGIVDCSVLAADFAPGTITSAKLAGSIGNDKLANSAITIGGEAISLGSSDNSLNLIDWQAKVTSDGSTVTTMIAGQGYFVDNSSAAGIVKLPASAAIGDTIAIKDYAGNFGTNKLTIQRNGHNIQGQAVNGLIGTNRASLFLVYVDSTKGWLYTNEHNVADLQEVSFISATGGTVTTSGNDKIHTFTGDGNFVVASVGNDAGGTDKVSYMVVAGGGAGMAGGAGGGAGGYREGKTPATPYTASPKNAPAGLTVSAQTYPITVGGGGTQPNPGSVTPGGKGSNSVFSTITSAGGGGGGNGPTPGGYSNPFGPPTCGVHFGEPGGSGSGAIKYYNVLATATGGSGNTPPVSPSQGNDGGDCPGPGGGSGAGGGGAASAGADVPNSNVAGGGNGGNGTASEITASSVTRAGGGGGGGRSDSPGNPNQGGGSAGPGGGGSGGSSKPATAGTSGSSNTGGGGGGGGKKDGETGNGGTGGSGIVVIRYKYQ